MEDEIQGRVQVEYMIGVDGKITVLRVKGPKGGELLEKEAKRMPVSARTAEGGERAPYC